MESAATVLAEAMDLGQRQGLPGVVAEAIVATAFVDLHTQAEQTHAHVEAELEKAVQLFEEAGDKRGLAQAMTEAGRLPFWAGRTATSVERLEVAASHARAAGDRAQELAALGALLTAMVDGVTPLATAIERADEMAKLTTGASRADVILLRCRGDIELALGHHDMAGHYAEAALQLAEDLGLQLVVHCGIARLRGQLAFATEGARAAEQVLRPACEALDRMGDVGHLVTMLPYLADALYALGHIGEIDRQIDEIAARVVEEDMDGQVGMRRARAKARAGRGDLQEAERFARDALVQVERTDFLPLHCVVLEDLADLLLRSDRRTEAAAALESALALHERKGSTGPAQRARARLATLAT